LKKLKAHQFQNIATGQISILYSGIKDCAEYGEYIPCYQFDSKEFPIFGEFTGYPFFIMKRWMESLGYKLLSSINIAVVNDYKNDERN